MFRYGMRRLDISTVCILSRKMFRCGEGGLEIRTFKETGFCIWEGSVEKVCGHRGL